MLFGVAVLLVAAGTVATRLSTGEAGVQYEGPTRLKRDPLGFNARGFHDDIFGQEFGVFHTVKRSRSVERPLIVGAADTSGSNGRYKREIIALPATKALEYSKRRPEMGSSGFHGDTFSGGFGEFWTMKKKGHVKRDPEVAEPIPYSDTWPDDEPEKKSRTNDVFASDKMPAIFRGEKVILGPQMSEDGPRRQLLKNKADWQIIISESFPMKPYMKGNGDAVLDMLRSRSGLIQAKGDPSLRDAVKQGSSVYEPRPEIGEAVIRRDVLRNRLAELLKTRADSQQENLQKRRPEMGSSGFHGNMFSNGFGEFWPMKKNTLVMRGGDGVDKLLPMKRRPEMDSLGFHGDTFHNGFGDFWPMKRAIPAETLASVRSGLKTARNYTHLKECCVDDETTAPKISVR